MTTMHWMLLTSERGYPRLCQLLSIDHPDGDAVPAVSALFVQPLQLPSCDNRIRLTITLNLVFL